MSTEKEIHAVSTIEAVPEYELWHDELWNFAISKAEEIYPNKYDGEQRMIMAKLFYQKAFDYVTHGGNK